METILLIVFIEAIQIAKIIVSETYEACYRPKANYRVNLPKNTTSVKTGIFIMKPYRRFICVPLTESVTHLGFGADPEYHLYDEKMREPNLEIQSIMQCILRHSKYEKLTESYRTYTLFVKDKNIEYSFIMKMGTKGLHFLRGNIDQIGLIQSDNLIKIADNISKGDQALVVDRHNEAITLITGSDRLANHSVSWNLPHGKTHDNCIMLKILRDNFNISTELRLEHTPFTGERGKISIESLILKRINESDPPSIVLDQFYKSVSSKDSWINTLWLRELQNFLIEQDSITLVSCEMLDGYRYWKIYQFKKSFDYIDFKKVLPLKKEKAFELIQNVLSIGSKGLIISYGKDFKGFLESDFNLKVDLVNCVGGVIKGKFLPLRTQIERLHGIEMSSYEKQWEVLGYFVDNYILRPDYNVFSFFSHKVDQNETLIKSIEINRKYRF
jgi:hypothetical protein